MGADETKPFPLEDRANAAQQVIVSAAKRGEKRRQYAQGREIKSQLPDRRPHQAADEHHVATALRARDTAERAELPEPSPVMRISADACSIGKAAQRKQENLAA